MMNEGIMQIMEHELFNAMEHKDKDALHRFVLLLHEQTEKISEIDGIKSDIKIIAETMQQGFKQTEKRFEQIEKRFEQVDKRFEDMNRKFLMMFAFISLAFTILSAITVIFKFIKT